MNKENALAFLRKNQPCPSDWEMPDGLMQEYDSVLKYFLSHPDKECVPLFLNSFGDGDGWGVYVMVEPLIEKFMPEDVVPHLACALIVGPKSVRYWCAQIASAFPSTDLIAPLCECLKDNNSGVREFAAFAISRIQERDSLMILRNHLNVEANEEIRNLIFHVLMERGSLIAAQGTVEDKSEPQPTDKPNE